TRIYPHHDERQGAACGLRGTLPALRFYSVGRAFVTLKIHGEAELRHWLVDYLVTTIGCSPETVDPDLSLHELGVGSRDAVVLSGELSELLGRSVSPVEFWQHPTVNALAAFLTAPGQNGHTPDVATSGHELGA